MNKNKSKKFLISLNVNIALVALTIIAMLLGIIDTQKQNVPYISAFKYFTVLSNILLGISAAILVVYSILVWKKKVKEVPKWVYIFKLCSVTATTITFAVVICFLTPVIAMGFIKGQDIDMLFLYSGSNTIMHLISPITAVVSFLLLETRRDIKLPQITFSLIFTSLYEIFYTTDAYLKWLPESWGAHDWYYMVGIGIPTAVSLVFYVVFTFFIAWLLWLGNRKIHVLEK